MIPTFSLRRLPRAIEPTSAAIELCFADGAEAAPWTHFGRLTREQLPAEALEQVETPHWFGPESRDVLVGYDCSGIVFVLLLRTRDGYETHLAPAEWTGLVDERPSVRLVFEDPQARRAFVYYLLQLQEKQIANPSLELLMSKTVGPPILCGAGAELCTDDA